MTTPYDRVNDLEEIEIIAGSYFLITATVYDENGLPVDITTGTQTFLLCPYGRPDYEALSVAGTAIDTNVFTVELGATDTESLYGKYLYQLVHTDFLGKKYKKQGIMTIVPAIV